MDLKGRRAFVTGATGFLGHYLVDALLARGAHVTALARRPERARRLRDRGVTIVEGDVLDLTSIDASGADVFFHNAAWVGFGLPRKKAKLLVETNVEGTRNALSAAERAGVKKFVHTSSIAAIGDTRDETATEVFPRTPLTTSAYERSKLESQMLVQAATRFDVAVGMPGLVVGAGSDMDVLFRRLARGKLHAVPVGDTPTGVVHARDVAEGLVLAAEKGKGPYLLVDENLLMADLFRRTARAWGVPEPRRGIGQGTLMAAATLTQAAYHLFRRTPPLAREHVVALRTPLRFDAAKARAELGWQPRLWEHLAADRAFYAGG